ncbi:hypothetical protein AB9K41_11295 [Cribrihabitans sp. XS_ASV171]
MRFTFPHSHAFPRGRVTVTEEDGEPPACLVEFSNGVTVIGEFRREGDDILLDVPRYRTERGTVIDPRRWRLSRGKDGTWRSTRET